MQAAEDGKINVFISEKIASELTEVLAYPKISRIYQTELRRQDLVEQVLKTSASSNAAVLLFTTKQH